MANNNYKKFFRGDIVRFVTDSDKDRTWKYAIVAKDTEPVETCVPVISLKTLNKDTFHNEMNEQFIFRRYCTIELTDFNEYASHVKRYVISQIEHHEKMIKQTRKLVKTLKHVLHHFEKDTKEYIKAFRETC